ncbi:family 1 glycosyl transferase [Paenibacillus sp. 32O-W]|uniref:glycosyltransferase family protein n=1 Tax=Paenibacillus sp. 32O-W TaxID=1695218 RepID=UPI0007225896|nr:glycosyltransferase [Paenibacillus sp. 32O-W]ALS25943.1 family 1 glycosyl transferase [Paenibacillus sp. 32O-W]
MDLNYIMHKMEEINKIRSLIYREMGIKENSRASGGMSFITKRFARKFTDIKSMKIACIMDEFTYHSFEPECKLLQITPQNWEEEMETFKPDLFFLESAWRGVEGLWNTKVAHLSEELIEVFDYCKNKDIPVVFWNKEDPVHFNTFLSTAKYADFVFTTDIDCIRNYKTLLKHDRVYLMPFAAQTKHHNPIEIGERKDKFCFAGAYYKRYPERIKDLETFIDTITLLKDLDIYDRNYYNNDPNYAFPNHYKRYIIGNLKPEEINKAYKGYRFNINLNSVKQSQSMCARRVFELLASNTVTVSNYSRAIRNLLGDLVVCTDDGKRLQDEIIKFNDPEYYNKFRLAGLRKVMAEHTYGERLAFLVNKVFVNPWTPPPQSVAVIARVETIEGIEKVIKHFKRQSYEDKMLYIISDIQDYQVISENIQIIKPEEKTFEGLQSAYKYWAFFSSNDYYGRNYLYDLMLAFKYAEQPVISKATYFTHASGTFNKLIDGCPYQVVDHAYVRKSLIQSTYFATSALKEFSLSIDQSIISAPCLSIDEYNYCMNYSGDKCVPADDLFIPDTGISMCDVYERVERIQASSVNPNNTTINPEEIYQNLGKSKNIAITQENDGVTIESHLDGSYEYLYFKNLYNIYDFSARSELDLYLNVEFLTKISVDLAVVLLDKDKNKINSLVKPCNRKVTIAIDRQVKYLKIGYRFSGKGLCKIKELIIGEIELGVGCHLNKSNALLITDNYPEYQDLYRYAFIHSRLCEYKNRGQIVDVFRCNDRYSRGYSEFGGIDITTGYYEEINNVLMLGNYDTILIHFLTESIWNGIKNIVKGKRIIVWVHGSEIQPWWRRAFNYSSEQELKKAKEESEKRMVFWRNIFNMAVNGDCFNFHFVFVSNYFANEVFDDIGFNLPENYYSVIHNYINSDLFRYKKKNVEARKKILSIRPFTSATYANDLTVKAILELSSEPIFKDLEFRIIGKGELFKTTVKPLKKFKNVHLEEKFLRQEEIAELHKEYGVFLVPTRMDSQGVSRDEAMSSGLVPITNSVAAIPEFVDYNCGMLVDPEDYKGLADSIKKLYYDPDLFLLLSEKAALRVRSQSGIDQTIQKEVSLIEQSKISKQKGMKRQ